MKKLRLLFIIMLTVAANSQTNDKKSYSFSMQQAIDFALKNNYKSINASRDIEASKQKKWETTSMGLPQVNGRVDFLHNFKLQQQGVSGNAFNPLGNPDDVSTIEFGTKNTMIGTATLSQLIFDGSYIVALQASKAYLQFFENAKLKTDNDIKEMIINSLKLVILCVFVPLWQNYTFQRGLIIVLLMEFTLLHACSHFQYRYFVFSFSHYCCPGRN